jgi:DNA polymerase delta subunit 1
MYTRPETHDYIDTKGIQLVRRDSCPLVKEVSMAALDAIMYDKSPDKAMDRVRDLVGQMLRGEFPIEKFVLSKTLRSGYKDGGDKLPHVAVARKIQARRGFPPSNGERVQYVFVEDMQNPDALQATRAEDPDHVQSHGLRLDILYYLDHQLESPIVSLFSVMMKDPRAAIFDHPDLAPSIAQMRERLADAVTVAKRKRKNVANRQNEITRWLRPSAAR